MSQEPEQGQQPDSDIGTRIENEQTQQPAFEVGSRLRGARESKNLSVEEVAERLCFTPSRVRAIEQDDYSQIQAKAYALGYVQLYAKILGLPVDDIITAFNEFTFWDDNKDNARVRPQYSVITRERITAHHSGKWLGVGIGILVVILAGLWWRGMHHHKVSQNVPTTLHSELTFSPTADINQSALGS